MATLLSSGLLDVGHRWQHGASSDEGIFVLMTLSFGGLRCSVVTSSWWLGGVEACILVESWLGSMPQSDRLELFFSSPLSWSFGAC